MRLCNMTRLSSLLALALFAAFVTPALANDDAKKDDAKANVDGTWKWSYTTQNGDTRESTAKLKQDGDKVTGTITGRQGGETEIKDGKLEKGELSFTVVREFNGNTMTSKYHGKVEGDSIKGKMETKRGDGESRERDWEAKREKKDGDKKDGDKKEDSSK